MFTHDDAVLASDGARNLDGQIVGLGAGAHEEARLEPVGKHGSKPFGQTHDLLVEISGVGVELGGLTSECGDDAGVGVADRRHVVVAVEQLVPVDIGDPDVLAANEMYRVVVEQLIRGGQGGFASSSKIVVYAGSVVHQRSVVSSW